MNNNPLSPDEESKVNNMIEDGAVPPPGAESFRVRAVSGELFGGGGIDLGRTLPGKDQDSKEGMRAPEGSFLNTVGLSRPGRAQRNLTSASAPVIDLALDGHENRAVMGVYEYDTGRSEERSRDAGRESELTQFKRMLDRGVDTEAAMKSAFIGFPDRTGTRSTIAFVEDDSLYVATRYNRGGIVIDRDGEIIQIPTESRSVSKVQLQPRDRILMGTPNFGWQIGGNEHAANEIRGTTTTQTASDRLMAEAIGKSGQFYDMTVIVADCKG